MPVNVLNRFGPINFSSLTSQTENNSINSLLSSFSTLGSENFSLSESYLSLKNRTGDNLTDTKESTLENPIGVGLIDTYDNSIRFSKFYGASFLSSSIVLSNGGTVLAKVYSPSVLTNNNFLTDNGQDKVFKFSLYEKTGTATPIVDSDWKLVYSSIKSSVNFEKFYDLASTKSYKVVVKDCLTNAFTSSMFVGNCTNTNFLNNNSFFYTITSRDLNVAKSLLITNILNDRVTNNYSDTQVLDLTNILENLQRVLTNPNYSKPESQLYPKISFYDDQNYLRNLTFKGILYQKKDSENINYGYFYTGTVIAESTDGTNPILYYSFEETTTFGTINLYIHAPLEIPEGTSGTSGVCTSIPEKIGEMPYEIEIKGPRCGILDFGTGKPQLISNPVSTTQVRYSGSFTITNINDDDLNVEIDVNGWTDNEGNDLDEYLTPIIVNPSIFTVPSNSNKKVSLAFGLNNYQSVYQPISFNARTTIDFSLPDVYFPSTRKGVLKVNFDKNSCITTTKSKIVISEASNVARLEYFGKINENWTTIKNRILSNPNGISGVADDKVFSKAIITSLPNVGCELPTSTTIDGYTVNLTWNLITNGQQPYVCNDSFFSGTYNITSSNQYLGTSYFSIVFKRQTDISTVGSYITLTQLFGTSNPF